MARIYRRVNKKELEIWQSHNLNDLTASHTNDYLFIPNQVRANINNFSDCDAISFYYKLEQILTCSLYSPDACYIISIEIPDSVLNKFGVIGYYSGNHEHMMSTAYEYLIPKQILIIYGTNIKVICGNEIEFKNIVNVFLLNDDINNLEYLTSTWPERHLCFNHIRNDILLLLSKFEPKLTQIPMGLLFPDDTYISKHESEFDFKDQCIGYDLLLSANRNPNDYSLKIGNFVIPHPDKSLIGYIYKYLNIQCKNNDYTSVFDLYKNLNKEEFKQYIIQSANNVFNSLLNQEQIRLDDKLSSKIKLLKKNKKNFIY